MLNSLKKKKLVSSLADISFLIASLSSDVFWSCRRYWNVYHKSQVQINYSIKGLRQHLDKLSYELRKPGQPVPTTGPSRKCAPCRRELPSLHTGAADKGHSSSCWCQVLCLTPACPSKMFVSSCPGATMILFQLPNGAVILHTGDFRADPSMERSRLAGRKVHTLFLDTTWEALCVLPCPSHSCVLCCMGNLSDCLGHLDDGLRLIYVPLKSV